MRSQKATNSQKILWLLKQESGQALIEAAISVPILLLLLTGAAEFARLAYASIEVSNAASAAVQYGASSHAAAADWSVSGTTYSGGIVNAAVNDAANLTGSNAVTVSSISVSCTCTDVTHVPTSCSDNQTCESNNSAMVETLNVQTTATYNPLIRYFYMNKFTGPSSMTLNGRAKQTVSNQ